MRKLWRSLTRILLATSAALALLLGLAAAAITQPTFGVRISRSGVAADPGRLRRDVERLTDLAPRDSDHPERLDAAAVYLRSGFAQTSARVFDQTFPIRGRTYRNVVADFGPTAGPLLVVGAHYDSFGDFGPNPGADDNASGAAGLLELARLLTVRPPPTRVELVAYANEEPPWFGSSAMGSAVHARSLRGQNVRGMICLEMIGYFTPKQPAPNLLFRLLYPSRGNFIAVVGRWPDRALTRAVKRALQGTGFPAVSLTAPRDAGIDASDQRSYWDLGIPAVMVTDTSFVRNPSYHAPGDTAASLDYARMARVVEGVAAAVGRKRSQASLTSRQGCFTVSLMNRTYSNLGPALFSAAAILAASALVKAAPHATWAAVASPALLVLALLGADLVQRRSFRPSTVALVLAASFVAACGLLASGGLDQLAPMIPILGSSVMLPLILRAEAKRPACRQAQP